MIGLDPAIDAQSYLLASVAIRGLSPAKRDEIETLGPFRPDVCLLWPVVLASTRDRAFPA